MRGHGIGSMMVADLGHRVQAQAGQSAIVLTYPKSILL